MTDSFHEHEQHIASWTERLNWLRAGVLGANDGIVSTAGLVVGVAGATNDKTAIFVAGLAGLVAGAFSMAAGEYVSVSAQKDTETALLAKEAWELEHLPEEELVELAAIYEAKGLRPELALEVAQELTNHDALRAHAEVELNIDPDSLTNPWHAAWASFIAFTCGAIIPILLIMLMPLKIHVMATIVGVAGALALTGYIAAGLGDHARARSIFRNVAGGLTAMLFAYLVGSLIGAPLVG